MTPVQSTDAGPADLAGPAAGPPAQPFTAVHARALSDQTRQSAVVTSPESPDVAATQGSTARLVLIAALAGAALAGGIAWILEPGGPATPTVRLTAHHSRFEPDRVTVKPGSTVRFVIHNADPIDHEFIIGPPETHDIHERGLPHFHTGAVQGEVTVPAGATVETTWTFGPSGSPPGGPGVSPGQPERPEMPLGEIQYGCHLAGHWTYGMHGKALIS